VARKWKKLRNDEVHKRKSSNITIHIILQMSQHGKFCYTSYERSPFITTSIKLSYMWSEVEILV